MSDQTESTLELDEDESLKVIRREWWAERIGWFTIAACLSAALLGFLGPGPLTSRKLTSDNGRLRAEYYAVPRYSAPVELKLAVNSQSARGEFLDLAFSQAFVDAIKLESITPEPVEARLEQDRVAFRFRAADVRDGHIAFRFEHQSFGPLSGTITLLPDSEIELWQFVCP